MGTSPLAGWATQLIQAKVTFRGFDNGRRGHRIADEGTIVVPHLDHANIIVGTGIGTGGTSNTGTIVYGDLTTRR